MAKNLFFVYGTLKKDEPNHYWLTKKENGEYKFVGKAKTQERYPLIIASKYNIPFLLDAPGEGKQIEGEIYEVDDTMMSNLDVLEEYPKLYNRKKNKMNLLVSGEEIECWIYLLHTFKPSLLELPFLSVYSSKGSHGLEYIAEYIRSKASSDLYNELKPRVF